MLIKLDLRDIFKLALWMKIFKHHPQKDKDIIAQNIPLKVQ